MGRGKREIPQRDQTQQQQQFARKRLFAEQENTPPSFPRQGFKDISPQRLNTKHDIRTDCITRLSANEKYQCAFLGRVLGGLKTAPAFSRLLAQSEPWYVAMDYLMNQNLHPSPPSIR